MSVEIKEVTGKKELKRFVKFNIDLYKGNPYHVPGLIEEEMMTLDKEKNPAFEVCEAIYFLAYRDGKVVGRIAGMINRPSNEVWGQKRARFGFVDFIDDDEVVDALFAAVERWARSKGMEEIHGPMGFTDMDHEGMLIEGFDQIGTMATIYNYPYYPKQVERIGYTKDQDWHEFKIYIPDEVPEKHLRIGEIVKRKYGLKVMKFKKAKELLPYAHQVFHTLNAAFAPLYGFAPLTERQIDYYIKMYISMLRLDNVTLIADPDNELVGVGIAVPSMARALQKSKGKLFPTGFYHLLKALKGQNDVVDLLLVAVRPDYQNKGVNALLFSDLIPVFIRNGYKYAESNPELEINGKVQSQWQYFDYEQHKRRRAFIKAL